MNALTRDLIKLVDMTEEMMKEKEQKEGADYREKLHLMLLLAGSMIRTDCAS